MAWNPFKIFQKQDKQNEVSEEYTDFAFRNIGNGTPLWNKENNEAYIDLGYRTNDTLYAIVNHIIQSAAAVPVKVYTIKSKSSAKSYDAMTKGHQSIDSILETRKIKEQAFDEVEDSDLNALLERPNGINDYTQFISSLVGFGKITGNRYIWGISPETGRNMGKPKELHVLPSQYMEIVSGGYLDLIRGYKLMYNGTREIPAEQICHIKDFNPAFDTTGGSLYGQSPLTAAFRALETNNEAVMQAKALMMNQGARGILMPKDPQESLADKVQSDKLKQSLKAEMINNRGSFSITPKRLELLGLGMTSTDMALLEMVGMTDRKLAATYHYPYGLLDSGNSTYENQEQWKKSLYQDCVIPELTLIRNWLNIWLAPKFGNFYIDFDFSAISVMQPDQEKLARTLNLQWWKTGNQKREKTGDDIMNDPLMDKIIIPQGMQLLEDLELGDLSPLMPNDKENEA